MQTHLFLFDIGIWLLSDRAVSLLVKRSYKEGKLSYYDMYSDFGLKMCIRDRVYSFRHELLYMKTVIDQLCGRKHLSDRQHHG